MSVWPTLPTLVPDPPACGPGPIDSSLHKDQRQPFQINYLLLFFLSIFLSFNAWTRDRIPVWTWLNFCWWRPLIAETRQSPISFSLLLEDSPPAPPHLSPKPCQRDNSFSSGAAETVWDSQPQTPKLYLAAQSLCRYELGRYTIWSTRPPFSPPKVSMLVLLAAPKWQN